MILSIETSRPRNVDSPRAAAILYGDWGTSKAYVIGLAFAVAGYSSFWLIAAMCVLTGLVGLNYVVICKHYPDGGGVYASVRHRSEVVSIVGAFLLIADYIVTAAISSLSAFQYLGAPYPSFFAAAAIVAIGALNLLGPKHTGGLAVIVSILTAAVVLTLGAFTLPHLGAAVHNMHPLTGGLAKNWSGFVSIVLALSGVEAIANATGVMKLNPGSTPDKPSVTRTSTPAILWVAAEVCFFTALLGLGMLALPGLHTVPGDSAGPDVDGPGAQGVRDYMLRYMGQKFVGHAFGAWWGTAFGTVVAVVFGLLLLSAVNTAIGDLVTIQFLMSRDGEMPPIFKGLNRFGVPAVGAVVATIIPAGLVLAVSDVSGLADLYAVGVVGAIATNLGATSTDRKMALGSWERGLMFFTFVIMAGIEISLLIDKPNARYFALTILVSGLVLRELAKERAARRKLREDAGAPAASATTTDAASPPASAARSLSTTSADSTGDPMLCAIRGMGRTLDFALKEAEEIRRPLYLLFVREQTVITSEDRRRKWMDDEEAGRIFRYAKERVDGKATMLPCYAVSDSAAGTIVDVAATVGASRLILGAPHRGALVSLLRGNIVREVSDLLPEDIELLVFA
jgi:amino acid transporter/nucleotide-binding universal stress UspA family protein